MSFGQATVLRLSKCFYRDTLAPQAVNLDQSYSVCMWPGFLHVCFCFVMTFFLTVARGANTY